MLQNSPATLSEAINTSVDTCSPFISGAETSVLPGDLLTGSLLGARSRELSGGSVLIAVIDQLVAVAALIELDGVARRIVLYPPDLSLEHLPFVARCAAVDAVVSDRATIGIETPGVTSFIHCDERIVPRVSDRNVLHQTEWILLKSGTTGTPKLVVHTLSSLAGAIEKNNTPPATVVWSTFYDVRRYGGLQMCLRAMFTGASLVLSSAQESAGEFLARAGAVGVTRISGTPSHWRHTLMSASAHLMAPEYIRLSGKIADQALLDQLQACGSTPMRRGVAAPFSPPNLSATSRESTWQIPSPATRISGSQFPWDAECSFAGTLRQSPRPSARTSLICRENLLGLPLIRIQHRRSGRVDLSA
jgi:AMP-binding enzyme